MRPDGTAEHRITSGGDPFLGTYVNRFALVTGDRTVLPLAARRLRTAVPLISGQIDQAAPEGASLQRVGQDAQYTGNAPRYQDNGDGTVTDLVTGLMWQGCSRGQTGSSCTVTAATTANWSTALSYCDGLTWNSYSDWRLPDEYELQSLVHYGLPSGARIDLAAFPGTVANSYWSSSSYAWSASYAWYLDFACATVMCSPLASGQKTETAFVRCVRGGP